MIACGGGAVVGGWSGSEISNGIWPLETTGGVSNLGLL